MATKSKSGGENTTTDKDARDNASATKFAFPTMCRTSVVVALLIEI